MIKLKYKEERIMTFDKWFNKQSRLVQILLLLIPFVNWVVEILVRFSLALRTKNLVHILVAVLIIIVGLPFGWLDLVWVLLFNHMLLAK